MNEADRLVAISRDREVAVHSYPDILSWTAPQTQANALVSDNGRLVVEGLGSVSEIDQSPSWTPRRDFGWQWVRTGFGQTLLIKRRPEVRPLGVGNSMTPPPAPTDTSRSHGVTKRLVRTQVRPGTKTLRPVDIDRALDYARLHIEDDGALGYTVRQVARRGTSTEFAFFLGALFDDLRHLPAGSADRAGRP